MQSPNTWVTEDHIHSNTYNIVLSSKQLLPLVPYWYIYMIKLSHNHLCIAKISSSFKCFNTHTPYSIILIMHNYFNNSYSEMDDPIYAATVQFNYNFIHVWYSIHGVLHVFACKIQKLPCVLLFPRDETCHFLKRHVAFAQNVSLHET